MDVAEFTAAKARVVSGNSASEQLRDALFDGKPTAQIRTFLAGLKERLDVIERDLLAAQAEAEGQWQIEDNARSFAQDVAHRLKLRLASLEPPPIPTHSCPSELPA
jgi:hypothetical protein